MKAKKGEKKKLSKPSVHLIQKGSVRFFSPVVPVSNSSSVPIGEGQPQRGVLTLGKLFVCEKKSKTPKPRNVALSSSSLAKMSPCGDQTVATVAAALISAKAAIFNRTTSSSSVEFKGRLKQLHSVFPTATKLLNFYAALRPSGKVEYWSSSTWTCKAAATDSN